MPTRQRGLPVVAPTANGVPSRAQCEQDDPDDEDDDAQCPQDSDVREEADEQQNEP